MNLYRRIDLLEQLGKYMGENDPAWEMAKQRAFHENGWFIPEFIDLAVQNIAGEYLSRNALEQLASSYELEKTGIVAKKVGIVMAGNIPLVGFHDLLCVLITGHMAYIKLSSRDQALFTHLAGKLREWEPEMGNFIVIAGMLKNCDAYIATGSNNTARYFEYYFRNHPSIIRKNRTSVAFLTGRETQEELEKLADDVFLYFGLGCRNVTKLYVPEKYNFEPLLEAFRGYDRLADVSKYRNNYDYQLASLIINGKYYMATRALLLVENTSPFSPVSLLHYEFYTDEKKVREQLEPGEIQCIVSNSDTSFGEAQCPAITSFADQTDTMRFLVEIGKSGLRKS